MISLISSIFEFVFSIIGAVFSIIGGVFKLVFGLLGGVLGLIFHLGTLLLVGGLAYLAISRHRHFRKGKKAQQEEANPRVIEMEDGDSFVSYYAQEQR